MSLEDQMDEVRTQTKDPKAKVAARQKDQASTMYEGKKRRTRGERYIVGWSWQHARTFIPQTHGFGQERGEHMRSILCKSTTEAVQQLPYGVNSTFPQSFCADRCFRLERSVFNVTTSV
eukprot:6486976-Amphidinium_carterae.1